MDGVVPDDSATVSISKCPFNRGNGAAVGAQGVSLIARAPWIHKVRDIASKLLLNLSPQIGCDAVRASVTGIGRDHTRR